MHTAEVTDFRHSAEIWRDFPGLVPGIVLADGITHDAAAGDRVARFTAIAKSRLTGATESELPEIQAWRRAFTRMGLKPTQYRCASEALLRRFRKDGTLPRLHPLVDVCNAVSLAFAVPVAVFDVAKITGRLEVRYAAGDEDYLTFSGQTEHPGPREVIFADQARQVHARRWTNRGTERHLVHHSGGRRAQSVRTAVHVQDLITTPVWTGPHVSGKLPVPLRI